MAAKTEQKKRLGKGLKALIPDRPRVKPESDRAGEKSRPVKNAVRDVAVEIIEPNPDQPRRKFGKESLLELAASIKKYGVLQPLLVRRDGDKLLLIAGERRLRASIIAGMKTVPVIEGDDRASQNSLRLALVENIQRVDLNPVEEASAFAELQKKYRLTQEQISEEVGKSRPYVANALRLLNLPSEVLKMLTQSEITTGHAKALLETGDKKLMKEFAALTVAKKISVAELSRLVKVRLADAKPQKRTYAPGPDIKRIIGELESRVGTRISIKMKSNTKGDIIMHYSTLDELGQILKQLKK